MRAGELIKYLQMFPEDNDVLFIILNMDTRTKFNIKREAGLTDTPIPFLCFEIDGGEPFDDEENAAADHDGNVASDQIPGQKDIFDYLN